MKVRNGFVSNSSSSSFCIFGAIATEEIWEHIKHLAPSDLEQKVKDEMYGDPADYSDYLFVWSNEYKDCPFDYVRDGENDVRGYIGAGNEYDPDDFNTRQIEFSRAAQICATLGLSVENTKIFYGTVSR